MWKRMLKNLTINDFVYFKYACVISTDIEKSVPLLKKILLDNHRFNLQSIKLWWFSTANLQVYMTITKSSCYNNNIFFYGFMLVVLILM